ncbi:unnamed protein product [Caenorhabditis sp. 36 PRJEB53466]|nr:unnamed protein product [Caenorhabditis sp. 36 PRJEB53466]
MISVILSVPKIYKGSSTIREDSPWTVFQGTGAPNGGMVQCTATIISPRHIITASHCVAVMKPNGTGFEKILMDGTDIEQKDCDGDDYYINDTSIAEKIVFYGGINVTVGQDKPIGKAKSLRLLGACKTYESNRKIVDLTLIELAEALTFGPDINMACVSNSMSDVAPFLSLNFYGYGSNPREDSNQNSLRIATFLYEESQVLQPQFVFRRPQETLKFDKETFLARSVLNKTVACEGDSGGGAIRRIRDQNTVVAVISHTTCSVLSLRTKYAGEIYVPVSLYNDQICNHTGICSPPPTTIMIWGHANAISHFFVFFAIFVGFLCDF